MFVESVFLNFSMNLFQFSGSVVWNVFLYCYYNYTTSCLTFTSAGQKTKQNGRVVSSCVVGE